MQCVVSEHGDLGSRGFNELQDLPAESVMKGNIRGINMVLPSWKSGSFEGLAVAPRAAKGKEGRRKISQVLEEHKG